MPKIRLLDKHVAELIAAGEVVERPSSVVKELVENSVDAGATVVTVEIRNGGASFIRITDNGCGMAQEDVPTAFLRHATSKIGRQDDLDAIATLGFRGEALASVSAVSHVELLTRTPDAALGVRYMGGGDEPYTLEEAGCPAGTTILVRDLFYNVPARMKFLKKDITEGNAVAGVMDKVALSHPEVSFRFLRDGKEQLRTPGDGKLASAIYAVYGKEFSSSLLPVAYELGGVKVSGFVTSPAGSRPNRSMQNFFINGRFIRSKTAGAALEEACKGSLMVGKFPGCVLHLELAFGAVDVNVHPAKLEVRFVNERPIFDAVYHGVKSAMTAGDKAKVMPLKKPVMPLWEDKPQRAEQVRLDFTPPKTVPSAVPSFVNIEPEDEDFPQSAKPSLTAMLSDSVGSAVGKPGFRDVTDRILEHVPMPEKMPEERLEEVLVPSVETALQEEAISLPPSVDIGSPVEEATAEDDTALISPPESPVRLLGEAFGTYIVAESGRDGLLLIDKHAAHERLLYEKLKREATGGEAQALLSPVAVTLDKEEYSAVLAHVQELAQAGFEIDDFGAGSVLVRSVPLFLEGEEVSSAVMEIAGHLVASKTSLQTEHLDWIYHNVACRAAMKAGDPTSVEELLSLVQQLNSNPEVRYCPHGRPVYVLIEKKEIEKQFGRLG